MALNKTMNPVGPDGSSDPRDFQDNVRVLDKLMNGSDVQIEGRLNNPLQTIAALQAIITSLDLGSFTFADTAAGLAGTSSGQYFRVPQGVNTDLSFIYYKNDNDQAIEVANLVGKNYIDSRLTPDLYSPSLIPLFIDEEGNVPLWLKSGKLGGVGLDDSLNPLDSRWGGNSKVPLFIDEAGNVPLWLEGGKLSGILSEQMIAQTKVYEPFTLGKSLWAFKAKCAALRSGSKAKLKIGLTGDSWTEHSTIAQAFLKYFTNKYGKASTGWIQFGFDTGGTPDFDGVKVSKSGWSTYDMATGNSDIKTPPYPTGMDGMLLYSSLKTDTLTISNLFATSLVVFYPDLNGTLSISVNGGEATNIAGGGTGELVSREISGLNMSTASQIVITTANNTGTVAIAGLYAKGLDSGVEVDKMGNGYSTAFNYTAITQFIPKTASIVAPDILFIILGTNDVGLDPDVTRYATAISALIDAWKGALPNTGIVIVTPALSAGSPKYDKNDISKAAYQIAKNKGVEFFSLSDFMADYSKSNSYGLWRNTAHLSDSGASFLLNELNTKLLGE